MFLLHHSAEHLAEFLHKQGNVCALRARGVLLLGAYLLYKAETDIKNNLHLYNQVQIEMTRPDNLNRSA